MRTLRVLLLATAIGAGIAMSALTPSAAMPHGAAATASAATPIDQVAPARAVPPNTISGAPWSSPAYPVNCRISSTQIACTPDDPGEVTPQKCFIGVLHSGQSATICTTFEKHTQAIQNAGGTELLVRYGCSIGDPVCATFENAGGGMAMTATAMMYVVATNMRFDTTTLLWTAAVGEWSFWQWAILIITFGAMVWAVAAAVVAGDREELVGALVRSFIAIPAVPVTLWLTGHLLNSIDEMTWYIMNRDGPIGLFTTLQSVMWAGGQANYFFAFLIHGLLMVGMLLLMLVFAFRNIVLAALIAVGPVAWMMFPVRGIGPQWVVRYVSAVVVLLLTGPLTIGFVTLIINGLANIKTIWDPQSWPLLIGLVLVAFAPFAIFGLFSFVGAVAADSVGSRLGGRGGQMVGNAARSAVRIPSRIGGLPSGIRPAGASGPGGPSPAPSSRTTGAPRGATSPSQSRSAPSSSPSSPSSRGPGGSPRAVAQPASPSAPTAVPTDRRPS